jgi:glycosyltransferase involved in cell wall biosynthesis
MKLSLVLATYGRADELDRCLASLADQDDRNFEVFVMDQNLDDRLVDLVAKFQSLGMAVRHERLPKPGLSEARNAGIRISTGDVIGFPDDDCWYEKQTIARIRQSFEENSSLSGIVADWVEQTMGGGNAGCNAETQLSLNAWRNFRGGPASSISLFLERDLLIALDGFDNRLGVGKWYGAGEETDLVLRALASGARIKRVMEARVHHAFSASASPSAKISTAAARARARGTGAIYAKHRLPVTTIGRGLVAPVLKSLIRLQFGQPLQLALASSLGRFEGMYRWRNAESQACSKSLC